MRTTTVGCYYAVQLVGNLFVTGSNLYVCVEHGSSLKIMLHAVYLLAMFGVSIIGTDILAHRFLHEQASMLLQVYVLPRAYCSI